MLFKEHRNSNLLSRIYSFRCEMLVYLVMQKLRLFNATACSPFFYFLKIPHSITANSFIALLCAVRCITMHILVIATNGCGRVDCACSLHMNRQNIRIFCFRSHYFDCVCVCEYLCQTTRSEINFMRCSTFSCYQICWCAKRHQIIRCCRSVLLNKKKTAAASFALREVSLYTHTDCLYNCMGSCCFQY